MPVFSKFGRYIEEVARRGSLRSAAEWLNIAPSAINRQIILAEEELARRSSTDCRRAFGSRRQASI